MVGFLTGAGAAEYFGWHLFRERRRHRKRPWSVEKQSPGRSSLTLNQYCGSTSLPAPEQRDVDGVCHDAANVSSYLRHEFVRRFLGVLGRQYGRLKYS